MEDARLWIKLAKQTGKLCLFGLYAFKAWKNNEPLLSSVILDVICLKGGRGILEKIAEEKLKEKIQSLLIYDGESYLLFIEHDGTPLEKVKEPQGTELIRDLLFKFTYPGTLHGYTREEAKLVKRYKL